MRLSTRALVLGIVAGLVLGACGGSSGNGISAAASARLGTLVHQVRSAAETANRLGAQNALTELQQAVASYEKSGDISASKAKSILADATRVQSLLVLAPTTTIATTTTSTTSTTVAPPPSPHGKHKGPGKGGGHKGGGDG